MAWLRNTSNNDQPVTNDYLRSADTVNRPASLLMLFIIILVLTAIAYSLFMGGRWLYNNINGKNNTSTNQPASGTATDNDAQNQNSQSGTPATDTSNNTSSNTSQTGGGSNASTTNGNTATNSSNQNSGSNLPTSGPTNEPSTAIPNTGPEPE